MAIRATRLPGGYPGRLLGSANCPPQDYAGFFEALVSLSELIGDYGVVVSRLRL